MSVDVGDLSVFGAWFRHHADTQSPQSFKLSWPEFVQKVVSQLHVRANKFATDGSAPGFSLANFVAVDGAINRRNVNVDMLSGVVLDFDKRFDPAVLFERLDCGIGWLAYTTFSHTPANPKWRVVIPTELPIPQASYKAVRAWLIANIINKGGGVAQTADDIASAASNFFYLPGCPQDQTQHAEYRVSDGIALALPPVSLFRKGMVAPRSLGTKIDWAFIKARLSAYQKDAKLRKAFKLMLAGKPFCMPGERNGTIFRMSGVLAGYVPQADPAELAAIFAPGLEALAERDKKDPPPTLEDVTDMIARGQAGILASAAQDVVVLGGDEPRQDPAPLTADEENAHLQAAKAAGFKDLDALRKRLILRLNSSVWVWRTDLSSWTGPMIDAAALVAARAELPRFPGVQVYTQRGNAQPRLKMLPEMMHENGEVIDGISYSLRHSQAAYNDSARKLTLPAAPRRSVEPKEDTFLAQWLMLLGGDKASHLLDWLACITQHERAAQILFLRGGPGTGKSLLIRGLSRIWNVDGATDYVRVSSNFNDDLLRCPLIALEEGNWEAGAKNPTVFLRRISAMAQHTINRKHQDTLELSGYVRIIMAMNNAALFSSDDHAFTPDDRDAIVERFLEIEPSPKARALLESMPYRERDALASSDRIAAHVAWLTQTRNVHSPARYAIAGVDSRSFATRVVTMTSWGSYVMEWLARYLSDPVIVERAASGLVSRDGVCVLVSPEAVVNTFATVIKNKRAPLSDDISNALASLAKSKLSLPNGKGTCFEIDSNEVAQWSEEKGIGNPAAIRLNASQSALKIVAQNRF